MYFLRILPAVAAAMLTFGAQQTEARDRIKIVGSSTVFPFATAVAERFGRESSFPTPVIESTGSGGGLKLFCSGVGTRLPDIANASRRIKKQELSNCMANGVTEVVEAMIGFDGIVIANARAATPFKLTLEQVYLALAAEVPISGKAAENPHQRWSDIDPTLPRQTIEVLGPPPTSGTRDAFDALALQAGCKVSAALAAGINCKTIEVRSDGPWVDAGENDNLIVSKLEANSNALGVFGFSFLDQNESKLQGSAIDGTTPTFDNIADGFYPVSRSLYFYVKKAHVGVVPGILEYVKAFFSPAATGDEGYLVDKGLIPLTADQFDSVSKRAISLTPMTGQEDLS